MAAQALAPLTPPWTPAWSLPRCTRRDGAPTQRGCTSTQQRDHHRNGLAPRQRLSHAPRRRPGRGPAARPAHSTQVDCSEPSSVHRQAPPCIAVQLFVDARRRGPGAARPGRPSSGVVTGLRARPEEGFPGPASLTTTKKSWSLSDLFEPTQTLPRRAVSRHWRGRRGGGSAPPSGRLGLGENRRKGRS
jgi:hypothetical protein